MILGARQLTCDVLSEDLLAAGKPENGETKRERIWLDAEAAVLSFLLACTHVGRGGLPFLLSHSAALIDRFPVFSSCFKRRERESQGGHVTRQGDQWRPRGQN